MAAERVRLGQLVRHLRQQRGWIRRTLGEKLDLGASGVRRLEAGRFVLTAARWERLTEALPELSRLVVEQGICVQLSEPRPTE